ncbi:hypothetical protein [Microbispora bryophytorum]|uniref:hypothetical protein n=1 Tax=Microbispora bryophytorum TaxID=1460882 RepID=UPI001157676F|nr:hypothetical protein [Microbispora bryophytorum]MBD3138276.1 hypothetical protein [Microbispora bryophytorum]TQS04024.1 hypothetical protein FLX07_22825 [Microbispora bryophytorum]
MRVVYRMIAVATGVVVLGAGVTVVLLNRGDSATTTAAPRNSADAAVPSVVSASSASGAAAPAAGAVATPGLSPLSSTPPSPPPSPPSSPLSSTGTSATPSVDASPADNADAVDPALAAALKDPRVPALPKDVRRLRSLPGRAAATHSLIKDRRSGVALPRFTKAWTLAKPAPFASRQLLPMAKGASYRGMLVSCPVPIPEQKTLRDTAFLAARWTLNHHPSGATITWTASQPIKAGKRKGWLLGYTVHYSLKGRKRVSAAALALVDTPETKPAVVFVTIPDSQKKRWHDINKVMSSVKAL